MDVCVCVCSRQKEREIVCVWCFACSQAFHSVREPFYWQSHKSATCSIFNELNKWSTERDLWSLCISSAAREARLQTRHSHYCQLPSFSATFFLWKKKQDGAAMFGCRPGRSAKTMLLFTFLLTFDFYFYTHNIGTDHLWQKCTLGHWKPLH